MLSQGGSVSYCTTSRGSYKSTLVIEKDTNARGIITKSLNDEVYYRDDTENPVFSSIHKMYGEHAWFDQGDNVYDS